MIKYDRASISQIQTIRMWAKKLGTVQPTQEQIDSWTFEKAASIITWYKAKDAAQAPTYRMTAAQARSAAQHLPAAQRAEVEAVVGSAPAPAKPARKGDPEVPAGRYAVHMDGDSNELSFFKVDKPEEGKWAGWTFVKHLASDTEYPVKGARKYRVLEAIAADIEGALATYGREIGACGMCGKTLTNDESRAYGIGPDCRKKL